MFGGKKNNEERVESSERPVASVPVQRETPSGDTRTQIGSGTVIKNHFWLGVGDEAAPAAGAGQRPAKKRARA